MVGGHHNTEIAFKGHTALGRLRTTESELKTENLLECRQNCLRKCSLGLGVEEDILLYTVLGP